MFALRTHTGTYRVSRSVRLSSIKDERGWRGLICGFRAIDTRLNFSICGPSFFISYTCCERHLSVLCSQSALRSPIVRQVMFNS